MIKYSVKQDGRRGLYRGTTILVITTSRGMVMHSFRKAIIARTASESKGNFFCCWSVPLYRTLKIWYLVHYPCCLVVRLFIRHISVGVVPKEHFHICSQVQATTIPECWNTWGCSSTITLFRPFMILLLYVFEAGDKRGVIFFVESF